MPANRAKELALLARSEIPGEIRKRAIKAIEKAVRIGHSEAYVSLSDVYLDNGIPDDELEELQKGVIEELESFGYKVRWDDITAIFINF